MRRLLSHGILDANPIAVGVFLGIVVLITVAYLLRRLWLRDRK